MTEQQHASDAAHDDLVRAAPKGPLSENPIASAASVTLSIPESVEVRLVDASALADYEVWVLMTSILSSAVVGFVVASMQATSTVRPLYATTAILFAALVVICGGMAFLKRRRLTARARRIRFRIGDALPD